MKTNDPNAEQFAVTFTVDNALYVPKGADVLQTVQPKLQKLNTAGKTVLITDPYICSSDDSVTNAMILKILSDLKAKKIIFVSNSGFRQSTRGCFEQQLGAQSCETVFLHGTIHDRFWICLEEQKGLTMNSLTGMGKNASAIIDLPEEDLQGLLADLKQQGILADV